VVGEFFPPDGTHLAVVGGLTGQSLVRAKRFHPRASHDLNWLGLAGPVHLHTLANGSLPAGKMDGRKTANHNMNSKCKNIVTTPGGSDLQESLVAGGSGVKIRSNGAGLLLSLPVNRDKSDEGVSSMAPDSDKHATAETDVPSGTHLRDILHHRV